MFHRLLQNHKLLMLLILLVAALLRFYQLGVVPPSPDWDEAALGYNAYSILQTGNDEYGKFMPVVLRSFDDYKPALYTYLIVPLIPVFDLTTLAVRLPSAIMGLFAVFLTYLLVKELLIINSKFEARPCLPAGRNPKQIQKTNNKNTKHTVENSSLRSVIPIIAAALLAVSPWHIQFSRVAFEANVGVTLNIAFAYFFLKGLKKPVFLSFSAAFAALSLYTYQSEKVFVPLLVLALSVIYFKPLLALPKKYLLFAVMTGIVVVYPMLHFIATDENALRRAQATSIFSNNQELLKPSIEQLIKAKENNDIVGIILNNRRVVYAQTIVSNYFVHYSPLWLFVTSDIERHHAPQMGLLYYWELPFLLIGLAGLFLIRSPILDKRGRIFLLAWFLLAPVPAAFTNDVPHAVRTLNFLPTFQIVIAVGLLYAYSFISKFSRYYSFKVILYTFFFIFITVNFVYFLNQYFIKQNREYSESWQYGYEEAVRFASTKSTDYEKIIVSDKTPLDQSYIFFLYYLKYPPQRYQQEQTQKKSFANYEFRRIAWEEDRKREKTLLIGSPGDFPSDVKPFKVINYLNTKPAIYFVKSEN